MEKYSRFQKAPEAAGTCCQAASLSPGSTAASPRERCHLVEQRCWRGLSAWKILEKTEKDSSLMKPIFPASSLRTPTGAVPLTEPGGRNTSALCRSHQEQRVNILSNFKWSYSWFFFSSFPALQGELQNWLSPHLPPFLLPSALAELSRWSFLKELLPACWENGTLAQHCETTLPLLWQST